MTTEELRKQFEGSYSFGESAESPEQAQSSLMPPDDYVDPKLQSLRDEFAGQYTRGQQAQPQDRDYGFGITTAFMRGLERLRAMPDIAQGDTEELAQHMTAIEQYKMADEDVAKMEEIRNTEGNWAKIGQLAQNPRLVMQVVAESLPMMAAPIAGAVAGGVAGSAIGTGMAGPAGTAAGGVTGTFVGGGIGSYMTEYFASLGDAFQEARIDMKNPAAIKAAFEDPVFMELARKKGHLRSIPISIMDAASMGLAGRIAKPVAALFNKTGLGKFAGRVAGGTAELGMQAGLGSGGEAGAQLMSEGEINEPLDVILEGVAEIVPGTVEAGVSGYIDRRNERLGRTPKGDSPLAALLEETDPIVQFIEDMKKRQELGLPIPEMRINPETERLEVRTADGWRRPESVDIDPVTGNAVLRATNIVGVEAAQQVDPETGESIVDQDILDVQLEDALLDLKMELEGQAIAKDVATLALDNTERQQASVAAQKLAADETIAAGEGKEQTEAERQKQREIEAMYAGQVDEIVAADTGEAAPGSMLSQGRRAIEGEPIDVAGGQPAIEGEIRPEGINPAGGRPFGSALADAFRDAGIVPPDDEGPDGPPPPTGGARAVERPQRGPDTSPAEARAAQALEDEQEGIDERIAIREADQPATESDEFDDGIPFEPLGQGAPTPAVAWADERLAKAEAHGALDTLMRDVQPGGGVTLVPSEELGVTFDRRTPSTNPSWFQSIVANEGVGMKYVQTAVDKAKAGKRLGAKQKRIVQAMLDQADEYNAQPAPDVGAPSSFALGGTESETTAELEQQRMDEAAPGSIAGEAKAAAQTDAEEQGDMIGAGNKTDLAIHERNRKQAEKQAKAPAADMNVKGDMFTGTGAASAIARQNEEQAAAQTDVEDAPAKRKEEKEIPLREASTSDLEDLAAETEGLIEKYIEKGETGGGLDQTEILGGIQKLKLHNHPRAADLERVAKDAIAMHRKKASKSDLEDLAAEAVEAEEYAQELDEQGQKDLAFIERQHEKWRQLLIKDENAKLPATTVNIIKGGIEDFAKAGHPRTFELAKSHDHWTNFADGPIKIKSNDPYYKKARKTNKVGSVQGYMVQGTNPDGRHINISIDGNSWTVPYNSLTFETPKDKARLDWLISVYVAESSESPASTGTFVIDEEKFAEWGVSTEERVFDSTVAKKNRKAIDTKLKGAPFLSMEEADKVVQGWEDHAIAQRDQRDNGGPQDHKDNFNRVILSLFDTTGTWANPYALAGYDVRVIDIKNGVDIQDFSSEYLEELFDSFGGKEVYGILAACPCTTFSNSGTRWRESRHDNTDPVESRKIIEEMWGTKAAEAKNDDGSWMYASANDYGNELVAQTMRTLEYYRPKFWALENPEGRIQESAGLPDWRTGFQPHNFGEPYTKRTLLFGEFNEDLPTANVEPTEGSKMHKMSPSEDRAAARAETPVGFSYAFFMANNYLDADPLERTKADYWYVAGAIEEAFKAGVTEDEIRNTIEPDSDYEGSERESALEALRELIEGAPGKPTPPPSGSTLIEGVEAVEAYKKELAAIPSTAEINAAAAEADPTSATEAQKKAGNYKKGHLKIAGLDVAIENPIGTKRHGNLKLRDHYGYIKRTEGADADQIDVFVNEKAAEDFSGDIYIVDQMIDGKFDEHKVMLGYNNMMDARRAYKRNYNKDWKGAGNVSKMTLDEFKAWLALPGANNKPAANAPVGVESPAFKKMNKDIRYASGRDLVGAPTNKWIETVLSGGERKMGDMPDSVPLNIAVSELLKMQQEIKTGKPAPAAPVRLTYDQAVAAVAPVEKAMPGAPMEVLASYKQAPKPVRDRMEADGMTEVRAVFDPQTNKIYLFADQALDANDAVMTALHEKTHLGLRKAFGAKLDPLLDDIFKNVSPKRRADMQKIADQYNLDVGRQEDRRVMAEELLAHMAEHDVSDGIVNRAIAFIRKLLRDMGFVQEFNDNDIRAMIREAQGAVSRAEDRIAGVTLEEEVILDETGEVFIIEQQADQVLTGLDQRIKICEKLRACL